MARKYHIRWKQSDKQELAKTVKSFNAKIDRIAKKYPELKDALPEKYQVKQLKDMIQTRQDLNRELNALKRFTNKRGFNPDKDIVTVGNYNTKITKWQNKEMNLRANIVNRKRKKRLERINEMELMLRGQPVGYTKAEIGMGSLESNQFKPIKAIWESSYRSDIMKRFKALILESQSKYHTNMDAMFQENYIKGLERAFASDEISEVVEAIRSLSPDDFYKKFKSDYATQDYNISPINDPLFDEDETRKEYLDGIKGVWLTN